MKKCFFNVQNDYKKTVKNEDFTAKFEQHLRETCGVLPSERVLLAVSGGADSTLLCYAFAAIEQPFGVAHCNFQLRGDAADEDELFVKKLAETLEIPHFSVRFDTLEVTAQRKQSIQIVARALRYEWLEMVRTTEHFDYLATAHHLNDSLETMLYNLAKGCGIKGLHGILPKKNRLIRPFLFAEKKEILAQAKLQNVEFREDSSNETDKYTRNFIRHQIVPRFLEINPNLEQTFAENIARFREVEMLYREAIEQIKARNCHYENEQLHVNLSVIAEHQAAKTVLHEILTPFGFNNTTVEQILAAKNGLSGKQFFSATHVAVLDRTMLRLAAQRSKNQTINVLSFEEKIRIGTQTLAFSVLDAPTDFQQTRDICWLDADLLTLPLVLRTWRAGDFFQPVGMEGKRKKLKDFFRQEKLSVLEKEKIWLLTSAEQIVWVVGYRADQRFRVTADTKRVVEVRLLRNDV